ncbi:hypothetical protein PV05_09482 [Exophiala xenobiotica]|uniref:Uncharacterized protein n=1 Tax=Exophiala xenobiotica TaxID=348802 RepID=A0A0D2ESA3_9EURO|nr:uncharacterized protein PV05_09482 [Exophiala xenobiotica]KIW50694.1 hypothetical protein PV05_09482 [Exophiala xenobiotica]
MSEGLHNHSTTSSSQHRLSKHYAVLDTLINTRLQRTVASNEYHYISIDDFFTPQQKYYPTLGTNAIQVD